MAQQRFSNDTLIIAGALAFGLLSLALPFAVLIYAPDSEFGRSSRAESEVQSTLVRNPRSTNLKRRRLAFNGNCAIGEFKDKRSIEATITRRLGVYRLDRLSVRVTDMCIAKLDGTVHNKRERAQAIRAAGHPWIRAIDIAALRVEPRAQR